MREGDKRLLAAEWTVRPIGDHADAVAAIRLWHYSRGAPNTSTYRHGLYRGDEEILAQVWGVALWIPPTRAAAEAVADDWQGVLCLSRLVVSPDCPRNAASFLLGRSMRLIDRRRWPVLLTYADTRLGHTGAIYLATNWTPEGETAAGDVWITADGRQCGRKRGGFTFTADQMRERGYVKAPSFPKLRFVHRIVPS